MTEPGVEATVGPVLGAPRRARDRARILAVAAIAVLVVGVGIGLAGNGAIEVADASHSPGPSTTPPPASTPPSPGEPTGVAPSASVGLDCAQVRPGAPPEIRISSDAGSLDPVSGVAATSAPDPSAGAGSPWPVPGEDGAARLAGSSSLLLVPDGDACVRDVIAEYRPADPSLTGPFPVAFRTLNVSPPRSIVTLGPLPAGDWVVRIAADFFTGAAGQGNANVAERFFRVISGSGAAPIPTPESPPAVPCVPLPASAAPPGMTLVGTDEGDVVGVPSGTGTPGVVTATLGALLEIRSAGDACARGWQIQAANVDTGQTIDIDTRENLTSDPFQFAQNRWRLLNLPTGLLQITATMDYSADVKVIRRWSLIVSAPDFPGTLFRAESGATVDGAQGCEVTWLFPNGTGGVRSCTGPTIVDEVQTLAVHAGAPVRFEATDGWTILTWSATCGTVDPTTTLDPFTVVDGCDLGASMSLAPAVFLPRQGAPVVRMNVTLERDGVTVSDYVYAVVPVSP